MRKTLSVAFAVGLVLAGRTAARADDAAARAVIDKAVKAVGGEAELAKYKASTAKMKGTVHTMGMAVEFTGDIAGQGPDQQKVVIEFEAGGQKFRFVQVLNRDKGWVQINDTTTEMDEGKLKETKEEAHAEWVASLAPLKDKAFTLASLGEIQIEGKPAVGVKVSHKGRRDVNLYFDKGTSLLVKTETRVKDEESGQEVTEETFLGAHAADGLKQAMKITIKRDGKLYLEGEITEFKAEQKLDDSTFAKP